MDPGPRLALAGATRRFGSLVAVSSLDVTLEPGEIHAIIGENGAGKSTALKLLAGHLAASEGEVLVDESPLPPSPEAAMGRGIGMVHQHFMLIDTFPALDNLMLGAEPRRGLFGLSALRLPLDRERARRKGERIAREAGLELPLDRLTADLSVGERQRLEILRVLYRGARALLLDEPTAVLSPIEVVELFATLRRLADDGATIAVVTHRLDEVVRFCDRATVMRRGAKVLEQVIDDSDDLAPRLTRAIMGGEIPEPAEPPALADEAEVVLSLAAVSAPAPGGGKGLDGLSLEVRAGEVVGVAGVEGNGQRELARVLAGLEAPSSGSIRLQGRALSQSGDPAARVRASRERGLVVVHDDRHRDEMLLGATIADNLVLGDLGAVVESERVPERFARFDVYPPDPSRLGRELSGGNQQKVVMARALDRPLSALVLAQPTRGVDVGTARTIQHAVADVVAAGCAVLIISADLHELRSLSHRIVVLRKGRVVADLPPSASDEAIGHAMLGMEAAS